MKIQKQAFLSKLQDLSQSRSPHRTFSDWLEIAALTLHQMPYHSGELEQDAAFDRAEASYLERIKPYSREALTVFAELLKLTMIAHHTGYGDFLGEIAGEAALLNKGSGQFFTPYHLCRMMAKCNLGDVRAAVEKNGGLITVCEPACGAGALVIACAEEVAAQGVDPRACIQFDCTDISRDAFNMSYIQLSTQNLQAVVRHGDTLSNEYWEHRPTPQLRLFEQWLAPQRRAAQLAQAMRSLLTDAAAAEPTRPAAALFDLAEFSAQGQKPKRNRRPPDVVLERQMSLFGD